MGGVLATAALMSVSASAAAAAQPVAQVSAAECADTDVVPQADNLSQVESAVLCLINVERVRIGVAPVTRSWRLDRSALFHTADMVRSHYLGHEAAGHPSLLARIRGYGYFNGATGGSYAENVGAGPGDNGTARSLMNAWMNSPGHRTNLLYADFRDVGIAAVLAPPDRAFFADFTSTVYTTDFGRRLVRQRCVLRASPRTRTTKPASPRRRYCRPIR
jgi:uncharacterized protein YkwD